MPCKKGEYVDNKYIELAKEIYDLNKNLSIDKAKALNKSCRYLGYQSFYHYQGYLLEQHDNLVANPLKYSDFTAVKNWDRLLSASKPNSEGKTNPIMTRRVKYISKTFKIFNEVEVESYNKRFSFDKGNPRDIKQKIIDEALIINYRIKIGEFHKEQVLDKLEHIFYNICVCNTNETKNYQKDNLEQVILKVIEKRKEEEKKDVVSVEKFYSGPNVVILKSIVLRELLQYLSSMKVIDYNDAFFVDYFSLEDKKIKWEANTPELVVLIQFLERFEIMRIVKYRNKATMYLFSTDNNGLKQELTTAKLSNEFSAYNLSNLSKNDYISWLKENERFSHILKRIPEIVDLG